MVWMIPMGRYSRLHPVNSLKHIVDIQGGLSAGTTTTDNIVKSDDAPVLANVDEVQTGSTVSSIFLNVQVASAGTAALANVYLAVYKNPGGSLAAINPQGTGSNDNKRFIIHQEMIMCEKNSTGIPRTLFKGVILIPKSYKRMGYNDTLKIGLRAPGVDFDYCWQAIYKEVR